MWFSETFLQGANKSSTLKKFTVQQTPWEPAWWQPDDISEPAELSLQKQNIQQGMCWLLTVLAVH